MKSYEASMKTVIAVLLLVWTITVFTPAGKIHAQPMVPKATGQQAVTASAVALPVQGIGVACLKGVPGNALTVYVGLSSSVTTSNGYPLAASESVCTQVTNLSTFWVIASNTGSSISWITFNNAGQ